MSAMNVVVRRVDANGVTHVYATYRGVDQPHSVRTSGSSYYYQQDASGKVVGLIRADGTLAASYRYDPFGRVVDSTGAVSQHLRYKARESDANTGLVYMRARWYDPSLGRFIAEDPIGLAGGVNPYAYAGNDPVNGRDPSGTCTLMATVNDHYYSDGSTSRDVLGYYWEGTDCFSSGSTASDDPKPEPKQKPSRVRLQPACANAAPMSSEAPNPYPSSVMYAGVSARDMFSSGGNGQWGQLVRGCLACAYSSPNAPTLHTAHMSCYSAADQRTNVLQQASGGIRALFAAFFILQGSYMNSFPPGVRAQWPAFQ